MIIDKIASVLSTGGILRGVRRSGKSTTARAIQAARGGVFADAAEWRVAERDEHQTIDFVTGNAEASLAEVRPGGLWVVDNAEVLVLGIAESFVSELVDRVDKRRVIPVLVRNRYILEDRGSLADRERSLRQALPVVDLPRPSDHDLRQTLARDLWGHPNPDEAASWVAKWSNCLPGLAYDLLPLASVPPDERELAVEQFVLKTIDDLELRRFPRAALLSAARMRRLPPMTALPEHVAMEVGYLMAAGALQIDQDGSSLLRLQGPLWHAACVALERASSLTTTRMTAKDWTETALGLADAIDRANGTEVLADELHVPCDVGDMATAIECILEWWRIQPNESIPLPGILARAFGRAGLRVAFRRLGHEPPSADKYALAEIFVRVFGAQT